MKPINPKGNLPWILIARTDAEAEAPIFWPPIGKNQLTGKDPYAGKYSGKEEKGGGQRMRWLDCITISMGISLSKFREILEDMEAWHAAVHGITKSQTWLSYWTTTAHSSSHFVWHGYFSGSLNILHTSTLAYFQSVLHYISQAKFGGCRYDQFYTLLKNFIGFPLLLK